MASNLPVMASNDGLQPTSDGLQPSSFVSTRGGFILEIKKLEKKKL